MDVRHEDVADLAGFETRGPQADRQFVQRGAEEFTSPRVDQDDLLVQKNSMREMEILRAEAREVLTAGRNSMDRLLIENIRAEKTKASPEALVSLLSTFFSGLCLDLHFNESKADATRKARDFVKLLRTM